MEQISVFDLLGQLNKDNNEISVIDDTNFDGSGKISVETEVPSFANEHVDLSALLTVFESTKTNEGFDINETILDLNVNESVNTDNQTIKVEVSAEISKEQVVNDSVELEEDVTVESKEDTNEDDEMDLAVEALLNIFGKDEEDTVDEISEEQVVNDSVELEKDVTVESKEDTNEDDEMDLAVEALLNIFGKDEEDAVDEISEEQVVEEKKEEGVKDGVLCVATEEIAKDNEDNFSVAETKDAVEIEDKDSISTDTYSLNEVEIVSVSDKNFVSEEENIVDITDAVVDCTENKKTTKKSNVKNTKKSTKRSIRYTPVNEELPMTPNARLEANIEAIELLYKVENEGYKCKSKDLSKLAAFTGWGGLSKFFEPDNSKNAQLKELLGQYYQSAAASVTTSYYTPSSVVKFKYELIKRLGFEKGRILDCSTGVGRYFSYMNKGIYDNSKLYGVELDVISSKICSILHPDAKMFNSGFEKTNFEDNYFDLCISNIPFGDLSVFDNQDKHLNKLNLKIHDYFFMKALSKVRVGGLVAFITSAGFMDKKSTQVREMVSEIADLVGAYRLPNTTFNGTTVVSDIIILRKTEDKNESSDAWMETMPLEENGYLVNEYFINKPECVIGEFKVTTSQYGETLTVANGDVDEKTLKSKVKYISAGGYAPREDETYLYDEDQILRDEELDSLDFAKEKPWVKDLREDEYACINDILYKKERGCLIKQKESMAKYNLFKKYALLKGALLDICTNNDVNDSELFMMQDRLNSYYEDFVQDFGYINEPSNVTALSKDLAGFPRVSALENVTDVLDEETEKLVKVYTKADIFTKRTVGRSSTPKKPESLQEAIILSFGTVGRLDLNLMAERLEVSYDEVVKGCIENNLIFYNYELQQYEDARDFLSGYVKDKLTYYKGLLDRIENANEVCTVVVEHEFFLSNTELALSHVSEIKRNITELEKNQPDFVEDVEFSISSTWIPLEVKRKFIISTFELRENVINFLSFTYDEKLGYNLKGCIINSTLRTVEWGTPRVDAERIVVHALNETAPVVKDRIDERDVVNVEQTQLAVAMVNKWAAEFKNYIFNNPDLHLEIIQLYNDLFVRTKEKEHFNFIFDAETNPQIKLRECQLKGVSRCITANTSQLLFYETGVGKTFTMQVLAYMKYKMRMQSEGKPNKTVIVVPNSLAMSGQFAREFLTLYPNAKVLGLTPRDFEKKNRRKVLSKIATNNWHAVILPHSVLDLIPLKQDTLEKYFNEDINDMTVALNKYESEYDRRSAFSIEKMIANRKAQMEKLLDIHKDVNSIYWEDLGVDDIMIDEAHEFKSLFFVTKKERIAGISNRASQKASNLYNIVRYQQEKNPASVTFATATPITNTIGELYNFTRYLNPNALRKRGIYEFDAWSSTFGSVVNEVETDVTGRGFKMKPRFAKFFNIPELMQIVKEFADVVFTEDVAEINVPNLVTGKPINVEVEPTQLGEEAIETLVELVGMYEQNTGEIRKSYNMLKICGEGRKIAVSQRLLSTDEAHAPLASIAYDIHASKELSPKLSAVVEKAYEVYTKHPDMSQVVFCDIGVPKGDGYSAYQEIKDGLVAKGLKEEEVVFIHDCGDSPQKRQAVIKKVNDGVIKVLIGSTSKMGVGVNMQKRLVALHHVDSCWLPSDIKQREGRIIRSGNMNKEVYIFRYLVKNSFDVFSWQTLERKAKFIHQITSGAKDLRSVDDLGSESISYAEAKAAASGNPLLIEHCSLVTKYNELKLQEKNYALTQIRNKNRVNDLVKGISTKKHQLSILENEIEKLNAYDTTYVTFTQGGVDYTDRETILEVLKQSIKSEVIGYVYGMPVKFSYYTDTIQVGESRLVNFSLVTHQSAIYKRLEDVPEVMEEAYEKTTKLITAYEDELAYLQEYMKKPFALKDELLKVERRKTDIEMELYGPKVEETKETTDEDNISPLSEIPEKNNPTETANVM